MCTSKGVCYIFLLQLIGLQFLLANDLKGQSLKEVNITLQMKQATTLEILKEIESQTQFRFGNGKSIEELTKRYDVSFEDKSLEKVLYFLASEENIRFKRINNSIAVTKSSRKSKEPKVIGLDRNIQGKVTDAQTGDPLIGATVQVKGTSIGVITKVDGSFNLSVPDDSEFLVVSFVGFLSQELAIGNQTSFSVLLAPDISSLNEVVVIGYGTQEKIKFNGAVSSIDNERVNQYSSSNFEQSLIGNAPGVQILSTGKTPGEDATIQIRGIGTLTAGTNPLIVVDGIPLTEGTSLNSLNTRDIESVNILKDAASASIYGSRAANGVVLVTTKKGRLNEGLQVTYDGYYGVNQKIDNFELVDAYDAAIYLSEARNNSYLSKNPELHLITDDNDTRLANGAGKRDLIPTYFDDYLNGVPGLTNTDWEDEVYRNAVQQSHYFGIRGGTDKTDYSISFGYFDQESVVIFSDFERFNNVISLNTRFNKKVRMGINLNTSSSNSNLTGTNAWTGLPADPGHGFILMYPFYPVYNADGAYAISAQLDDQNNNWDGPISENVVAAADIPINKQRNFRTFGSTYLEVEPIIGLKLRSAISADYRALFREFFSPSTLGNYRQPIPDNPARSDQTESKGQNFLIENTINYDKRIADHSFNVLLGQSYQSESSFMTDVIGTDFLDNNVENVAGALNYTINHSRSEWVLSSLFTRLLYDYNSKYSLATSIRRDGSSRFGSNSQFATFLSLSAGWTFTEEQFFPNNDILSFGKLRASWGESGNNQIGDFSSLSLLTEDNYTLDGQLLAGVGIRTAPNPNLSWETSVSVNYGLDLGFFTNQLLLTAEYYKTNTNDLLLEVPVPQQTGFSTSLQNVGEIENRGFEFDVKLRGIKIGSLQFGLSANLSTNKNEVISLGPGQEQIIVNGTWMDFNTRVGRSIAELYTYDVIGIFKSQDEINNAINNGVVPLTGTGVGDYIVRDVNGDGVITPDDRTFLGDYNSEIVYGFGLNAEFKGFDISLQFDGIQGRELYDRLRILNESGDGFQIPTQHYFDNYYHPTRNPDGYYLSPNFNQSAARNITRASSVNVKNADFFRLRSLTLGYTIPEELSRKLGLNRARVYFTGNNLFQITNYRGLFSEGIQPNILLRGLNFNALPVQRFMAMGVTLNF